jgi:hypothetical protein
MNPTRYNINCGVIVGYCPKSGVEIGLTGISLFSPSCFYSFFACRVVSLDDECIYLLLSLARIIAF